MVQSYEPGESWFWNYVREEYVDDGPDLAEPTSHPKDQPAPGPRGRVPADWRLRLH